jgi:phage tail-like protein
MSTPPPVYTVSHVEVKITPGVTDSSPDGMNSLLFSSASTPGWSIDPTKHMFHGSQGQPETIISAVQHPKYGTVTLKQGWDDGYCLAKWRAQIEDPNTPIDQKKKTVDITFYKNDGTTELFTWHTDSGIMIQYETAASDPASNGLLTISVTIDADTWQQTIGGSPITGS